MVTFREFTLSWAPVFTYSSPTAKQWIATTLSQQADLLNPRRQMTVLLQAVRQDIDKQFDEKQGEWQPLAAFTVEKKAKADADPRILHETKIGEGLRLREAYRTSGKVEADGKIVYTYPIEKPYAKDHQMGKTADEDDGEYDNVRDPDKWRDSDRKMPWRVAKRMQDMDDALEDIFRRTK